MDTAKITSRGAAPKGFGGEVILPTDQRYEAARVLWNGAVDKRPAEILRPRKTEDVAKAILSARDRGLELAIRCGGHSIPGHSMSDGGMTIDLAAMNDVEVDPNVRRARVGGGALLSDVGRATAPHALSIPYGQISHTGVGGLTLGGGLGWLMRRYGLTLDSVRGVELVTANGEILNANEEENTDLFWAVRGGGGNFGVVTRFDFELHPHGPEVLAGMVIHPLDRAADAIRFSRDFMEDAPDELNLMEVLMTAPPEAPFPAELQGRPALALTLVYVGDPDEGEQIVRPLREYGSPALDLLGRMPPLAVQTMLDETAPHGMQNYNKMHWLNELPDAAIDDLVRVHAEVPSPMSLVMTARMGGAISRVPAGATAFGHRDAHRLLWVVSSWWEGDEDEQIEWCRDVFDSMAPYSSGGVYVNALDQEGPSRVRAAYGESVWRRLGVVKDRWDPDNVFRLNQNIPPSYAA